MACGCIEHNHAAWLDAHYKLGYYESVNGQLDWRARREYLIDAIHKYQNANPPNSSLTDT